MRIVRPLRLTAAAALSSVIATLAFAGPLAGSAVAAAGKPQPTPLPTLTSHPSNPTSSTTATFAWTVPVTETYSCSVDGQKVSSGCLPPVSFTGLGDGTHTFTLRAKLPQPQKSKASTINFSWAVDTTPPAAPTVQQVLTPTKNTSANVFFSGDSSAVSFACALDANPADATACTSPYNVSGVSEGVHTAYVYAFDAVGNRSAAGTTTWTVDTTAPGSPVFTQVPSNPTVSTSATFAWTDGDSTGFQCSLDGGAPVTCSSGKTYTGLSEGSHSLAVQGRDAVGNAGLPATYGWQIDLTAPVAPTFLTGPSNPTDQSAADFVFTDAEQGVTFLCKLDAVSYGPCTSPLDFPSLNDGSHELDVKAVDGVGNTSSATPYQWVIDTTGTIPLSPVEFLTGPNAFSNDRTPSFTWGSLDSTATGFQCSLDLAAFTSCGTPDAFGLGSTSLSGLTEGLHTFAVRETDGTNTSAAATWSWRYDATAPAMPTFGVTPGLVDPSPNALFSFASDADAHFTCSLDGAVATYCASPMYYPDLADQAHTFVVSAIDPAGNTSSNEFDWTIDTTAPIAPVLSGISGLVDVDAATVSWVESDPSVTGQSCKLDGNAYTPCTSPVALTGLADGAHSFEVTVVDAGAHSSKGSVSWTVDTVKPVLDVTGVPAGYDNRAVVTPVISQTAEVHPGQISCTLVGPNGTVNNCGPYPVTDGAYTLTVDTTDLAGNTANEVSRSWTTDRTKPVIDVTGLPHDGDLVNTTSFSPAVTDGDTNSSGDYTCWLSGPVTSTSCSDLSDLTDGDYTFTADTTDLAGNDATSFSRSWTVDTTKPVLDVQGLPDAGSVVNATSFNPTVTDADAHSSNTYTCSLSGPVTSSSCSNLTGLTGGDYTFTADTTDAAGNAADQVSVSWTVDTAGPAMPTLSSSTVHDGGVTKNRQPALTAADTDAAASYQCDISGDTTTVTCSVDPATGVVSFSDDLADGSYVVAVTAFDGVGNPSPASDGYAFDIDNAAPVVTLNSLPDPDAIVNHAGETPDVATSDAHSVNVACTLNGDPTTCASIGTTTDGSYTFSAVATDVAGNASDPVTRTWTVDRTKPVLDVTGLPAAGSLVNDVTETIDVSQGIEAHPGALTCSLTGPTTSSSCTKLTGLTSGSYTFTADTTDLAGNDATQVTRTWTVDATPPSATVTRMRTLTGSSTVTWTEPVHGVDVSKVTLATPDGGVAVPTSVTCLDASAAVVGCDAPAVSKLTVTPTRRLLPGQHYTLTVAGGAASDVVSNASLVATTSFRGQRVLQENTLPEAATWQKVKTRPAFGKSLVREHLAGAAASYRFRGSKLTWWTVTGPTQGKAAVYVGSRRIATVNNYAAAVHYRVARTFRHLGKGAHTLTVKALGRKGAKAGRGTFVSIDAFTVGTKRTNTPHLTSAWHRARASKFSGGHAATATLAGQAVSLRFRGTSITWTTLRNRSQGKARVYVDGVLKGTVDNYAATTLYKVRRVVRNLTDTVHTIRIVALGKHRKGGRGTTVTVDRFAIG